MIDPYCAIIDEPCFQPECANGCRGRKPDARVTTYRVRESNGRAIVKNLSSGALRIVPVEKPIT